MFMTDEHVETCATAQLSQLSCLSNFVSLAGSNPGVTFHAIGSEHWTWDVVGTQMCATTH